MTGKVTDFIAYLVVIVILGFMLMIFLTGTMSPILDALSRATAGGK